MYCIFHGITHDPNCDECAALADDARQSAEAERYYRTATKRQNQAEVEW